MGYGLWPIAQSLHQANHAGSDPGQTTCAPGPGGQRICRVVRWANRAGGEYSDYVGASAGENLARMSGGSPPLTETHPSHPLQRCHFWLLPPPQDQICSFDPLAVPTSLTSTHLLACGFTK